MRGFEDRGAALRTTRKTAIVLLVTVALLTVAGLFGRLPYFELATHFHPQYVFVSIVCAAIFLAARDRIALVAAVACAVANWLYVVPYYGPIGPVAKAAEPAAEPAAAHVRLMLSNVYLGNRDYDALLAAVRQERPDVLVLEEVTGPWWKHIGALRAEYPYYNALPRTGASGLALFSRRPLDEVEILTFSGTSQSGMLARLDVEGRSLSVMALHPPTPMRFSKFQIRNAQFDAAAKRMRETSGPRVLIGDLNTTPWSPYFQDLVRESGLRDARLGAGVDATWPALLPSFLRIPIDHCLTSDDVRVDAIRTGARTGSDHSSLVVDVALIDPAR